MHPVFWISGPPAAGKTSLCRALLERFERGIHLEVDQLRLMVTQGLADSVPWTEETEHQFQIAEEASCDVACRYQDSGFAVAVDHCRNLIRLESLISRRFEGRRIIKVCLLPSLETNLLRNHERTDKPFDPRILDDIIRWMQQYLRQNIPDGWMMLDTSNLTVEATVDAILESGVVALPAIAS